MYDFSSFLVPFVGSYDRISVIMSSTLSSFAQCSYPTLWLEDGEEHKSLQQVEKIWSFLLTEQATRHSLLVNVGGGTITDMGGFAAATYKRGINYLNIPTTLLAMVDAAWGGKTGFDYGQLKNSIGAFHTPVATLIDTHWLSTLPVTQRLSGYAEMLKHGLIADKNHWQDLLRYDIAQEPNNEELQALIDKSCRIKQSIVNQDPQETGLRQVLNFGHTIGHALETLLPYSPTPLPSINHGYAVLYGMIAEAYISHVQCGLDKNVVTQLTHLMNEYYGKPQCDCKQVSQLIDKMRQDKKNTNANEIRFTLLKAVGQPIWGQVVGESLIQESLDYLFNS